MPKTAFTYGLHRHQDAEPLATLRRSPLSLAPAECSDIASKFRRVSMMTAWQNGMQQAGAGSHDPERRAVDRLCKLPREELAHVRELVSLLEQAQDNEERSEIARTLLEVLFPKSIGGIGVFEEDEGAEGRERVDAYRKKVGLAIRGRREAIGMTQEKLAELAGIPQSHVSRLERGKHAPTHLTIQRVAAALKTKPSQLDPGFDDTIEEKPDSRASR